MKSKAAAPAVLALLALTAPGTAAAEAPPLELVFDAPMSIEPGVLTTASLLRVVFGYPAVLPTFGVDESNLSGRAVAAGGRTLALVFLDLPLSFFAHLLVHEVFGHGARAREQGASPTYLFTLVPPYSWLVGDDQAPFHGTTSSLPAATTADRDLPFTAGGIEAQSFAAYTVNRRIAASGGRLEYSDLLLYFGKLAYHERFLSDLAVRPQEGGGDLDLYLSDLERRFNLWRPEDHVALARRLERAWLGALIDPTLWLAVYHLFVSRLWNGERVFEIPFARAGDLAIYPGTRFNLGPFGAEHYLDLFVHTPIATFSAYCRFTSSGLATDAGGGVSAMGWQPFATGALLAGGELDVWMQNEILLDQRSVFTRPTRPGASVAARVDLTIAGSIGVIGKLAYKTRGYLMAQPIEAGPYGFLGLRLGL